MTSREERAAHRAQRLKETIAAKARELAQVEAQQRATARAARNRRRQQVGIIADEAGLLAWEDTRLRAVFAALVAVQAETDVLTALTLLLTDGALVPMP